MIFFRKKITLLYLVAETVVLSGDLNPRTGKLRDFTDCCDMIEDMVEDANTTQLMKMYEIRKGRGNMDKS